MNWRKTFKLLSGSFLLILLFLGLASPAQAFEPKSGDRVVIEEGQVIEDDFYVSANVFILKGTIKGDLVAVGTVIIVESSGVVEGDLNAAGQGVVVRGAVEDDARLAGAVVSIGEEARIDGDLVAAGFSVEVGQGSTVGGDFVAYASQVALSGNVEKDVQVGASGLQINGQVGGNVQADVGASGDAPPFNPLMFMPSPPEMPGTSVVPGGLSLGSEAKIDGNLTYTSSEEASIPDGAVAGQVTRNVPPPPAEEEAPPPPTPAQQFGAWLLNLLRNLITLLLVGLLLAWLLPDFVRRGAAVVQAKPLQGLLWGIVAYVGFFFVLFLIVVVAVALIVILSLITLGDLVSTTVGAGVVVVSGLALAFNVAVSYVSKILVGFLVGRLLLGLIRSDLEENRYWPLVLGVILFAILWSIPILGTIVNLIVILMGLGALWLLGREWLEALRKGEAPVVPSAPAAD